MDDRSAEYNRASARMAGRARWYQIEARVLLLVSIATAGFAVVWFGDLAVDTAFNVNAVGGSTSVWNNTFQFPEVTLWEAVKQQLPRLGAIVLAVFLMQLLFSVVRYRLQLAEALLLRADYLALCGAIRRDDTDLEAAFSLVADKMDKPIAGPLDAIAGMTGRKQG